MTGAFEEVIFPLRLTYATIGGPRRRTEIATLGSGAEERNAVWANSRREWNAAGAVKSRDDLHTVLTFWEAMNAQLIGFRVLDPIDFKSGLPSKAVTPHDQALGTGDASTTVFQLNKAYTVGARQWVRTIKKPIAGTVRVAVAGAEQTAGVHFNVDVTTGQLTFLVGHVPGIGAAVTAGFQFHIPARFNMDYFNASLAAHEQGSVPDIPLIEIPV